LSDDTPLLTALEAILLHRCNDDERKYYEALSPEEKTRSSIRFAIRFR
jgi:hypothetical protein